MSEANAFGGYIVTRPEIAHGGSGLVHEGSAPDGKRRVAIKVLDKELIERNIQRALARKHPSLGNRPLEITQETRRAYEINVERFKIEYRTLLQLEHPNIARVFEIGFKEGHFFIVSEFVDGKPLAQYVKGWEPSEMIPLFVQFLEGLDFIHRSGLIHLDIKSDNILVEEVEGSPKVKIIDFGLAMTPSEYRGSFIGTISTMAPEVALGLREKVNSKSDLYSAGVVMYNCITWGAHPFERSARGSRDAIRKMIDGEEYISPDPPSAAHKQKGRFVPDFLDKIILKLLSFEPENRFYPNARAVINALRTHMPEAFGAKGSSEASYLRPPGLSRIGREKICDEIEPDIDRVISSEIPKNSLYHLTGPDGIGKSHLISCLKSTAEMDVERIALHSMTFPMSDDHMLESIARLERDMAENSKPIILFMDDLHELIQGSEAADRALKTLKGLASLFVERRKNQKLYSDLAPVLMVATSKSGSAVADGLMPEQLESVKFEIPPFKAADLKRYLKATPALSEREISSATIDFLIEQTAGIPQEIVERLEELDSKSALFDACGEVVITSQEISLRPEKPASGSTRERLLAKFHSLEPAEREAAEIAACLAFKPFLPPPSASLIMKLLDRTTSAQTIRMLCDKGILRPAKSKAGSVKDPYTFVDEAYMPGLIHSEMETKRREMLHDAIFLELEKRGKKSEEFQNELLLHLAFSSDTRRAASSAIKLGRRMLNHEGKAALAVELLELALQKIDAENWKFRSYVLSLISGAHLNQDRYTEAELTIREAQKITREKCGFWHDQVTSLAIIKTLRGGDLTSAGKLIEKEKNSCSECDTLFRKAFFMNFEGQLFYHRAYREPQRSRELLEESKKLFEKSAELEQLLPKNRVELISNNLLYSVLMSLGNYRAAAANLEKQIEEKKLGIYSLNSAYVTLAEIYRLSGNFDKALLWARKALRLAESKLAGFPLLQVHATLANIFYDQGDYPRCMEECNKQISASACLGGENYALFAARVWSLMGRCCNEMGDYNKAILYFEAALAGDRRDFFTMSAMEGLGEAHFGNGNFEEMEKCFEEADRMLSGMPEDVSSNSHRYRILLLRARAKLSSGETDDLESLLSGLKKYSHGDKAHEEEISEIEERMAEILR